MKKNSERAQALEALVILFKNKTPLNYLITPLSPFSRELTYGVCRQYIRLECIAQTLVPKKPKVLEVWLTLLLGLYQLHYLHLPDYAVVKESVHLLNHKNQWAKGLINAALRRFCRESKDILLSLETSSAFQWGHPEWFIHRVKKNWPSYWQTLLTMNDQHPPMTLRINTQKTDIDSYQTVLKQQGIISQKHSFASDALILETPCDVKDLPGFAQGYCSVQDAAAQLAVSLLDLSSNHRVLDACCAPGGKTGHILEKEPHLSLLALDIEEKRLTRVKQNLERLKLQAILKTGDALAPNTWWDGELFDRILLDAPCSATGVIRRHPDIKLLRTPADIVEIAKVQAQLLKTLWPLLARGGRLVYATCSIMPEENELQISEFIKEQTDCKIYHPSLDWGCTTPHGYQILPGQTNMDGFFYSVLEKI